MKTRTRILTIAMAVTLMTIGCASLGTPPETPHKTITGREVKATISEKLGIPEKNIHYVEDNDIFTVPYEGELWETIMRGPQTGKNYNGDEYSCLGFTLDAWFYTLISYKNRGMANIPVAVIKYPEFKKVYLKWGIIPVGKTFKEHYDLLAIAYNNNPFTLDKGIELIGIRTQPGKIKFIRGKLDKLIRDQTYVKFPYK